jgi:hypothetical protein
VMRNNIQPTLFVIVAIDEINGKKILVKLVLYWAHAPTTPVLERQTYT